MLEIIAVASSIAGLLGLNAQDLVARASHYLDQIKEDELRRKRESVRHHMLI